MNQSQGVLISFNPVNDLAFAERQYDSFLLPKLRVKVNLKVNLAAVSLGGKHLNSSPQIVSFTLPKHPAIAGVPIPSWVKQAEVCPGIPFYADYPNPDRASPSVSCGKSWAWQFSRTLKHKKFLPSGNAKLLAISPA